MTAAANDQVLDAKAAHRRAILGAMREGGFVDALRSAGAPLSRVLEYVESFAEPRPHADPARCPDYPLFPGLRSQPFWDEHGFPGAARLRDGWREAREDWLALDPQAMVRYVPPVMRNTWRVQMLSYMGVDLEPFTRQCPRIHALLREVPGLCSGYPWADNVLSVHVARSHLLPHCSVDTLRVRCHLGLEIPGDCAIRVGGEVRGWSEGGTLLFDDSFEHEVWNRGDGTRAILIVDFWHPGLTAAEREALSAGFSHSRVRSLFVEQRAPAAQPYPHDLLAYVREQMAVQDRSPAVRAWWAG